MAVYFDKQEDQIVCKCGSKLFIEQPVNAYKHEKLKTGAIIRRTHVHTLLVCTSCQTSIHIDKRIPIENPEGQR